MIHAFVHGTFIGGIGPTDDMNESEVVKGLLACDSEAAFRTFVKECLDDNGESGIPDAEVLEWNSGAPRYMVSWYRTASGGNVYAFGPIQEKDLPK